MTNRFFGPCSSMCRIAWMSFVLIAMVALAEQSAHGFPTLPGDYNLDGLVSHADYSVLGDTFGSTTNLAADGNGNGIVDYADFELYVLHYGEIVTSPILPLEVVATPTAGGNVEWTFTLPSVNGALAGQMYISTSGPSILSAEGGPLFLDDEINPVGVPGIDQFNVIQQGVSFSGTTAFAALGTTLSISPSLLHSDSTLEFLRLVTAGTQPTTLTFASNYGYQGQSFVNNGSAMYVPEPASWVLACACIAAFFIRARMQRC